MTLEARIEALHKLGKLLDSYIQYVTEENVIAEGNSDNRTNIPFSSFFEKIEQIIEDSGFINPWFTRTNILVSLKEVAELLQEKKLTRWLSAYPAGAFMPDPPRNIGVVLAGNIPLVGFHDFISVLISGHRFIGKLSSKDDKLMPFLGDLLIAMNPEFRDMLKFENEKLKEIDAIIATGSDNTYRYFEYYFGKYPHIFRANRNGVAVLNDKENPTQLTKLADDVFTYFGLGCRSVAKLFVPEQYDFDRFFKAMENFSYLSEHHKYMNNYTYFKSVYLLNSIPFLDNGFLILKQDEGYHSPIACLFYEYYTSSESIAGKLIADKDRIQCVVGEKLPGLKTIPAGQSQHPELWDYADHIDTMDFLINLGNKKQR
ncbi:MAG: hypothetical protein AMS27_03210 [Bacteroides sp. SM23_62_1]|nr:MAG: hypothetical protein AMS27_03210 [Bacteroides sp. SM23_62_1]